MKASQTSLTMQHNQIIRKTHTLETLSLRKTRMHILAILHQSKWNKHHTTQNEFTEIYHTMACFLVDMICLTEHNLDTSHHTTCQHPHQTTKTTFDHNKLNFASSPILSTTSFKPGGTVMISPCPITT